MELDPGEYIFTASRTGFISQQQRVEVKANSTVRVPFNLAAVKVEAAGPVAHSMKIEDWDQPIQETGGWYTVSNSSRSDLALYRFTPLNGTIEFKVQPKNAGFLNKVPIVGHLPKILIVLFYNDEKSFTELEFDRQSYRRRQKSNGVSVNQPDKHHGLMGDSFHLRLTIGHTGVVLQAGDDAGGLYHLDDWSLQEADPTLGRFGFRFGKGDPLKFTDFSYVQNP
jgi:hypothetical protein